MSKLEQIRGMERALDKDMAEFWDATINMYVNEMEDIAMEEMINNALLYCLVARAVL